METPECGHPLRAELAEEFTTDKAKYMDVRMLRVCYE